MASTPPSEPIASIAFEIKFENTWRIWLVYAETGFFPEVPSDLHSTIVFGPNMEMRLSISSARFVSDGEVDSRLTERLLRDPSNAKELSFCKEQMFLLFRSRRS